MTYSDAGALPPCEFSAHCVRLLDDLDAPVDERALRQSLLRDARDMQDEYLIEKLRAHVPGCPVCSAKVADARRQRSQQRLALRRYLTETESRVPSTIDNILSIARQTSPEEMEQPSPAQKRKRYMLPEVFIPLIQPERNDVAGENGHFAPARVEQPPAIYHTGLWLRNGFALATAAALIFAALGVFTHFVFHNSTAPLHEEVKSWPSVMIGVSILSSFPAISKLYNIDTATGASEQMTPAGPSAAEMEYGTVSPGGKDVLYHYTARGQVIYATWSSAKMGRIVTRAAKVDVTNAVWMDNDHILLAYVHSGVAEFDAHNGTMVEQFGSPVNAHLLFYRAPYLYYQDAQQTGIYRSDLATGDQEQLVADRGGLYFTHCVMNPDGVSIYCEGRGDPFSRAGSDLYRVNGDGLGAQALSRRGILLGFAPDHTLLFLQVMLNHYQVVKLGETLRQDSVVMNNAAPASTTIESGDAMLAPDGHGLVVQDSDTNDSTRGVWYDDLTNHTSREVFSYLHGSSGQLIGWDQLRVPSSPLSVAPAA